MDIANLQQCLKNIKSILEAADSSLDNVVKVSVFLADINDYAKMNEVYCECKNKYSSYLKKSLPSCYRTGLGVFLQTLQVQSQQELPFKSLIYQRSVSLTYES